MDQSPILGDVASDLQMQAQRAAACGLIRVNGLPLWQFSDFDRQPAYVVEPLAKDCGGYCTNNSRMVIVTREGDVWWGSTHCAKWIAQLRRDFCQEFQISSSFVSVPASNGEEFFAGHLIARIADPFCDPPRGFTLHF